MLTINYTKDSVRALQRMPPNTAHLIRQKIKQYAADPRSLANNVKALKGEVGVYRLRVGDWRVIFTDDGVFFVVLKIAARGSAYN